jgi:glycosyltransferase involved in cell wall biosynthesis
MTDKLRILALCPNRMDGCTWYRLINFQREARRQDLASVEFLDPTLTTEQLAEVIRQADVFYCRMNETLPVIFEEFGIERMQKPIILDLDDAFDDLNPLSDSYQNQGLENIKLNDGRWLWKDGEKGFSIEENFKRVEAYKKLTKLATAVIVTTFELKNYVEQFNKNVVVIPNAIDFNIFPALPLKKDNTVTITWAGGSSHYADLADIKPILIDIMKTYPNVYYYHVGQGFPGILKGLPENRVKVSGWVTADGHGYRLATLNADIGLAPLLDSSFNRVKSSVKYYEYSAVKIPTLAKDIPPYSDDIVDGQNGMLYTSPKEFREKLEFLITNPLERARIAENAYQYVRRNRDIKEITKDWVEFMSKLSYLYKHELLQHHI